MSVQNSYGFYYGKLWLLRETNSEISGRTLLRPPTTRLRSQLQKISDGLMPSWSGLVPRHKLEQVMRNLTCGDQQIWLMVIWLVLTRVETEQIRYERLGSCFSWTYFRGWVGGGGSVGGRWNWMVFGGLLLGGSNAEKWGDHKKKKFYINNSVEVVISFK